MTENNQHNQPPRGGTLRKRGEKMKLPMLGRIHLDVSSLQAQEVNDELWREFRRRKTGVVEFTPHPSLDEDDARGARYATICRVFGIAPRAAMKAQQVEWARDYWATVLAETISRMYPNRRPLLLSAAAGEGMVFKATVSYDRWMKVKTSYETKFTLGVEGRPTTLTRRIENIEDIEDAA